MRLFSGTLLLTLLITTTATTAIPLSPPSDEHPHSNPAAKEPACASPQIKKCCTTLNKPAKAVTDVLDNALSVLDGLSIASGLAFSCKEISPDKECNGSLMCCDKTETDTKLVSRCKGMNEQ